MHIHQLMGWEGPMTQRQYDTWQAWLEIQWNIPSRADHYTLKVASVMAGKEVSPLKFGRVKKQTDTDKLASAKQQRLQRNGGNVVHRTITKEQLQSGNASG